MWRGWLAVLVVGSLTAFLVFGVVYYFRMRLYENLSWSRVAVVGGVSALAAFYRIWVMASKKPKA